MGGNGGIFTSYPPKNTLENTPDYPPKHTPELPTKIPYFGDINWRAKAKNSPITAHYPPNLTIWGDSRG